jgi:hypothetical protein
VGQALSPANRFFLRSLTLSREPAAVLREDDAGGILHFLAATSSSWSMFDKVSESVSLNLPRHPAEISIVIAGFLESIPGKTVQNILG